MAKATKGATAPVTEEYLKRKSATKEVYYFRDHEFAVDQKSREVYTKVDKEVHYPTPYRGSSKYTHITQFTYLGFDTRLPKGVYKKFTYGYGFTKPLWPLIAYLNTQPISEVVIEKKGIDKMDMDAGILYLSEPTLEHIYDTFSVLNGKHKAETDAALLQLLHGLFPKEVGAPAQKYNPGSIATSLLHWANSLAEFNDKDRQAIKDLFDKLTLLPDFFAATNMERTREVLDNAFIGDALREFATLQAKSTDSENLEKQWQAFLKKHSWIFTTLFAQPIILHKDEAYVGGKTLDNRNGKYNDFLIQSQLTNNVSFVEIKTHLTSLVENRPYRGNDVFPASKELSGCIGQVLNQRDNFQKEYYTITRGGHTAQSFNSRALIVIGNIAALTEQQRGAFELFRSNSRDVEILTFDELEMKIKSLLQITTGMIASKGTSRPRKKK
ncbi:MAG TPA: Shedu immune nuclease family protein [Puia sp.]|uniref:Shedu immune nuclease family protein n=1 Tax=Puia sp. TaxID=2045100 RepID=UPI002BEFD82B|nr:Shedu immune nuclease family protein [Puia sp.]HVU97777.1 Shedu immune nuclease family protein [Puia sp.]